MAARVAHHEASSERTIDARPDSHSRRPVTTRKQASIDSSLTWEGSSAKMPVGVKELCGEARDAMPHPAPRCFRSHHIDVSDSVVASEPKKLNAAVGRASVSE